MTQEFLDRFEEYCKTPGIDSGKARSYVKSIEYLCDYLSITEIDTRSVSKMKHVEGDICVEGSPFYQNLLVFLVSRGQSSYLKGGFIRAALKIFFEFFQHENTQGKEWTREETNAAFALYCGIPFSEISETHPQVIELSKLLERTPTAVTMRIESFGRFDEGLTQKEIVELAPENAETRAVWDKYHLNMEALSCTVKENPYLRELTRFDGALSLFPAGTTKTTKVQARNHQDFFRDSVLSAYNRKCCITGLDIPSLLIAAHIKPWADSDPATERTNPCNGLSLNTLHHEAFDNGVFTIDTDYRIIVSKTAKERYTSEIFHEFFGKYEGKTITLPERFLPSKEMIRYHNAKLSDF